MSLIGPTELWVLAVVCFALFIRGAFGFGDGLIAVPLISMAWSVKQAVPVILLLSMLTSVFGLWRERHLVQATSLKRTGAVAILSFPLGIFALSWLDETIVKACLGVALIGLSGFALRSSDSIRLSHPSWSYPFGFLAGFLGGAYALRGIVFAVYGGLRGWSPGQMRATLHSFYIISGLSAPLGFWLAGLLTERVLTAVGLLLIPGLLAGAYGQHLASRIEPGQFRKLLWWLVSFIGLGLLSQLSLS